MMKIFIQKMKEYLYKKEQIKVLGRWQIDYCNKKIDRKIDYSNEDHCGTCFTNNDNNKNIITNDIVNNKKNT